MLEYLSPWIRFLPVLLQMSMIKTVGGGDDLDIVVVMVEERKGAKVGAS